MNRNTLCIALAAILASTVPAIACSRSIVEPGSDTTDPVHSIKAGTSCSAYFNLEGFRINGIRIVESPRSGRAVIRGNGYVYTAGAKRGADDFVVELDTTQIDWYSGRDTVRTRWKVRQPFIVQ